MKDQKDVWKIALGSFNDENNWCLFELEEVDDMITSKERSVGLNCELGHLMNQIFLLLKRGLKK